MILSKNQLIGALVGLIILIVAPVGLTLHYTHDLHDRMMVCGDLDARLSHLENPDRG